MTDRRAKYEARRTVKRVSFNADTEADLLAAANALPDFSGWVKQQLQKQIEADQQALDSLPPD